jgi:NAD(P)-dependent dehydrogenase (short-subunit alcohol dehydrogenase family)
LTNLLLDYLARVPESRVITTTSGAQFFGDLNFNDLQSQQRYSRYGAYGQSKLANVSFAFELQRRLEAANISTLSVVAHPGLAQTQLQLTTAQANDSWLEELSYKLMMPLFGQSAAQGALPQLYAGTAADVNGADHIVPDEFLGMRGYPTKAKAAPKAYDQAIAQRLWEISETLTGIKFTDNLTIPTVA